MKSTRYSCQILMNLESFFDSFSKNIQIYYLMKIRSAGAKLFHADGHTDMTKLIVAFRNFVKAPNY
jgi:hypothetical protein